MSDGLRGSNRTVLREVKDDNLNFNQERIVLMTWKLKEDIKYTGVIIKRLN